jgi:hypothetical protein
MYKLVLFFFLLSFLGCKSNEPDHLIVGDWSWTGSGGGIGGGLQIKPKTNERIVLQFKRRGSFNVYQNDTLRISGDYQLEAVKSIYIGKDEQSIKISNVINNQTSPAYYNYYLLSGQSIILQLDRSALETGDNRYDGFGSSFKRIK